MHNRCTKRKLRNRAGHVDRRAPHGVGYHYYYLYGIERVGALSGRKEIGGKAWYPEYPLIHDTSKGITALLTGKAFGSDSIRWRACFQPSSRSIS